MKMTRASMGIRSTLITLVFALTACSSQMTTSMPSRTLPENGVLLSDSAKEASIWWKQHDLNWRRYDSVVLEPIAIKLTPNNSDDMPTKSEQEEIKKTFQNAVGLALSDRYRVIDNAIPGTLRIRCTITHLKAANTTLNMISGVLLFVPLSKGEVAIEVEIEDAVTGALLAVAADRKRGGNFDFLSGLDRLGHINNAILQWAQELRTAWDRTL